MVVAEGIGLEEASAGADEPSPLQASLSPLATGESTGYAIDQGSGRAAKMVANRLQLLLAEKTYPTGGRALGARRPADRGRTVSWALATAPARFARLNAGQDGVMVSFQPPDIVFVPLPEAINRVRTVPADSEMMLIARTLGICLGGA